MELRKSCHRSDIAFGRPLRASLTSVTIVSRIFCGKGDRVWQGQNLYSQDEEVVMEGRWCYGPWWTGECFSVPSVLLCSAGILWILGRRSLGIRDTWDAVEKGIG